MSFSSVLNIARSALFAQQRAMSLTAGNIANAQTPGYTRRRLVLQAVGFGGFGSGVSATEITRTRDPFLDASYRREAGFLGTAQSRNYFLSQVEGAMNEPSDGGVSAALDDFFNAFGSLAADPSNPVNREEVRASGDRLAQRIRRLAQSINDALKQAKTSLSSEIDDVNATARRIAELNQRIQSAGGADGAASDLLDQRDQLVDHLAGMLPVQVTEAGDGSITVNTGGVTLVTGGSVQTLEIKNPDGGPTGIGPKSGAALLSPESGSLKALTDLTATTLPSYLDKLDALAREVVTRVNGLHEGGTTADGRTGVDFFDPNGVTAATIGLSADVSASTDAIMSQGGPLRAISALAGGKIEGLGGATFGDFYSAFAADVGRSVRDAQVDEAACRSLTDQADTRRASVEGVSVDEEMVNLIGQQEAYQAAARLVGVADQMIQELLAITA
jgi:flagellar hook-associated protein 1 FlgK